MTRDDGSFGGEFDQRGWVRVLRLLSRTFHLATLLGVEVRVFWITLVLVPLLGILVFSRGEYSPPFLEVLTYAVLLTVWLYVVVWTHEMGHILAGRRFGIWTPLITLSPLGGLAHMSSAATNPRQDIVISLAGPATHLCWLAVVWPLSKLVTGDLPVPASWWSGPIQFTLDTLVYMNLSLLVFNLLPFFPMDGGRVLRAVLSFRLHPNRATIIAARVGQVGAVLIGLYGLVSREVWGGLLIAIGITNFFACRREITAARWGASPYAADAREAWQGDPDAWKRAAANAGSRGGGGPGRPGVFARWRARRRGAAAARDADRATQLEAEVDRVLARVSEVGMAGLTKAERGVLERASRERRQ